MESVWRHKGNVVEMGTNKIIEIVQVIKVDRQLDSAHYQNGRRSNTEQASS